jgi:hypothetical protein
MKAGVKYVYFAAVAVLIGSGAWVWWGVGIRDVLRGDIAAAFGGDLADLVTAHDGEMPGDWQEFETW